MIVAACKKQVLVPVSHHTLTTALHGYFLHHSIAVALIFAHAIAIDQINGAAFGRLQHEVRTRTRPVRQEQRTTGSQVVIRVPQVLLIVWGEVITDYKRGAFDRQFEDCVAIVSATPGCVESSVA